jgi:hypothetical protein
MTVNFNSSLSTHRSGANRVQKQKFGSFTTALAAKDSIGFAIQGKKMTIAQGIEKAESHLSKEDNVGKMLLNLFIKTLKENNNK